MGYFLPQKGTRVAKGIMNVELIDFECRRDGGKAEDTQDFEKKKRFRQKKSAGHIQFTPSREFFHHEVKKEHEEELTGSMFSCSIFII